MILRRLIGALVALGWAALAYGCTVVIEVEPGAGLGASCTFNDQCQASSCIDGVCAVACGDDGGCPGGTVCASGSCQLPLRVGFVFPYDLAQDDLGRSLDEGRQGAADRLGYLETSTEVGHDQDSEAVEAAESLEALGNQVIVAGSPLFHPAFATFASEHDDVTVLSYQGTSSGPNLISFDVRNYQAYYLAGIAAGKRSATGRVGILGSLVSPPIIASINAFALGVQRGAPAPVSVELRWIGELHDTQPKVNGKSRERRFTEEMIAGGCDIIAHTLDNNISLFTIADVIAADAEPAGVTLLGLGANVRDSCEALPDGRCLGTTYFNWSPLFERVLDDLHRQRDPAPVILEGLQLSDAASALGFEVGPGLSGGAVLAGDIDSVRTALASETGVGQVFDGPIESTGQCEAALGTSPCVPDGERLGDQGLAEMCWLVLGIVDELDQPALVPEEGRCAPSIE